MELEHLLLLARAIGDTAVELSGSHVILNSFEIGGDLERLVDRKAEESLFGILDIIDSGPDLITEGRGYVFRGGSGILVVDPVDGSVNADRGIPFFAVSIAYFEDLTIRSLKRAVIYDPMHRTFFYAEKNRGAFMKHDGSVSELRPPKRPALETVYMSLSAETIGLAEKLLAMGIRVRDLGSVALGMAYTAAGRIDAFVDLRGFLRFVDVAAGYLILKEAGYAVETKIHETFPYPKLSIMAAPRSMLSALKRYLMSEGYHNRLRR